MADGVDPSLMHTLIMSTVAATMSGSTAHDATRQATSDATSHSEVMAAFLGFVRETMQDELRRHASVGQEAMAATAVQLEMPPNAQSIAPTATNAAVNSRTCKQVTTQDVIKTNKQTNKKKRKK